MKQRYLFHSLLLGLIMGCVVTSPVSAHMSASSGLNGSLTAFEAPPAAFASSSVDRLQSDIDALQRTLDIYLTQGKKLDGDLQIVIKSLDLLDKMARDMQKLDNAMTTVDDLLKIARSIPQTEKEATALSNSIASVHPQVTQASTKLNNLDTKLAPTREKLRTFDDRLQKLITATELFQKTLDRYKAGIVKAQQCIGSLPSGTQKDDLQARLDRLSDASDRRVVQANKALTDIINAVDDVDNEIQTRLRQAMEPLYALDNDVEALLSKLNDLINPLRDLESFLKKSFSVSFPYPSPTWKNPFRIKHYSIGIGVDVILKGSEAIEKEIEHILSRSLYEAAKAFGLDKLVKDLVNQADNEMSGILRRLHLDIKIDIPGLSTLNQDLSALDAEFGVLVPKLDLNTQPLQDLMSDIQNDIAEIENIYSNCK